MTFYEENQYFIIDIYKVFYIHEQNDLIEILYEI